MKTPNLRNLTILYAEDDEIIRDVVSMALKKFYDNVFTAKDGEEAFAVFEKEAPDILISDIMMPNLTGLGLIKKIKESGNTTTKIVVTSAFDDGNRLMECIELGVDKFFKKPVEFKELKRYLSQVADEINKDRELEATNKLLTEYKKAIDVGAIVSKTDIHGVITYVNEEFCKVSGFERAELIGKPHNIVRHPENPTELYENMWRTISSKESWKGVLKNRRKDGKEYFVKIAIVPILGSSGEIEEYIAIKSDITDFVKRGEELNRLKLEQFSQTLEALKQKSKENLLDALPIPSLILDEEDRVLHFNQNFLDLFDRFENPELCKSIEQGEFDLKEILQKVADDFLPLEEWKSCGISGICSDEFTLKCGSEQKEVKIKLTKMDKDNTYLGVICQK